MFQFAMGMLVGIAATTTVAVIYHGVIVGEYKKAASTAGVLFTKVEGKVTAFRKGL